jgi:protein-disulfide isomerase/uncharacterized membrane protein
VNPFVVNRVLLILAFIGLFVSGVLSAGHILDLSPPCGGAGGCAAVASHPASKLFNIPVAYMGFVTYLLLAALAGFRSFKGMRNVGLSITTGYVLSAIGTAFSLYLQYQSFNVIHEFCPWCFTSAVVMIINLIGHAVLVQSLENNPSIEGGFPRVDAYILMAVPVAVIIATAVTVTNMHAEISKATVVKNAVNPEVIKFLIPENANSIGPKDAPLTIVEFADLQCPACQKSSPRLKAYREMYADKMRIVYRHFPLSMHQWGASAAAVAEYAAEKGKFWEYAMGVMGLQREVESGEELYKIADSIGLNRADLEKRIANPKDKIYERVQRDIEAGDKIGIQLTPTFFMVSNGQITDVVNSDQLFAKLQSKNYQALISDNPPATNAR